MVGEGHLGGQAHRTVEMERDRRYVVQNLRHRHLDRSHMLADGLPILRLVGKPRCFHDQQAKLAQLNPAIGKRSEEHTSELQSLMRISYAVFCLKKKKKQTNTKNELIEKQQYQSHNISK